MLWITIGIIAYGLLTGIVYTEVAKVNSPPPADMKGQDVGSLLYREYDAMTISDNGGLNKFNNDVRGAFGDFFIDFLYLVDKLESKKIDGMAFDQITFSHIYLMRAKLDFILAKIPESNRSWVSSRMKFLNKLVTVSIPQKASQSFTYGILVKNEDDYQYLQSAADDLRYTIKREWGQEFQGILTRSEKEAKDLFYSAQNELYSYTGNYFRDTLIAIAVMVLVICLFGILYEQFLRKRFRDTEPQPVEVPLPPL